ncbi:TPA: energy transducer TonB, partial [Proteus mirabilis]|nr:energy transducer TonB [Proteus mirabilis]
MKIKFILLGVFGGILLLSGFVAHAIKTIPLDMQKEATVVSVEKPKIVSRQFPYYPTG